MAQYRPPGSSPGAVLMPYAITKGSIDKVRAQLVQLKGDLVRFHSLNPQRLAYNLRQGIAAAVALGDEDAPSHSYSFQVGEGAVVAVPREVMQHKSIRPEPKNLLQVTQSILTNPLDEMTTFPNAILSEQELEVLRKWVTQKYGARVFISEGALVIGTVGESGTSN